MVVSIKIERETGIFALITKPLMQEGKHMNGLPARNRDICINNETFNARGETYEWPAGHIRTAGHIRPAEDNYLALKWYY